MRACVCGKSALELYRSSGRLLPDVLGGRRTARLADCGVPPAIALEDCLLRLGVKERPFHLLLPKDAGGRKRSDIVCHRMTEPLPPRSLIEVTEDIMVATPELTFLTLAAAGEFDVLDLALIGFEFCGTYVIDASWDGLTNTHGPMTSVADIGRVLERRPSGQGVARARAALNLVRDKSNSPMETVLCALLTFPRRLGGYGFKGASLNHRISLRRGVRYVDVAFPEYGVGLEYKGRAFHSIEEVGRDDRRQNEITGAGWTILNVWYEDLVEEHLFDRLMRDFARTMGVRVRVRSESFAGRRAALRAKLMPSIRLLGEMACLGR